MDNITEFSNLNNVNAAIASLVGILFQTGYIKASYKQIVLPLQEKIDELVVQSEGTLHDELEKLSLRLQCVSSMYDYVIEKKIPTNKDVNFEVLNEYSMATYFFASIFSEAYDFYQALSTGTLSSMHFQHQYEGELSILP